jgi:hypothetical protein
LGFVFLAGAFFLVDWHLLATKARISLAVSFRSGFAFVAFFALVFFGLESRSFGG